MLIAALAIRDLLRDRFFLFCNTAVMVGILVPLLVLFGVKNGVYAALITEMLNDPANLQIDTQGNASFSDADLKPLEEWPEIAFFTPKVRSQFDFMIRIAKRHTQKLCEAPTNGSFSGPHHSNHDDRFFQHKPCLWPLIGCALLKFLHKCLNDVILRKKLYITYTKRQARKQTPNVQTVQIPIHTGRARPDRACGIRLYRPVLRSGLFGTTKRDTRSRDARCRLDRSHMLWQHCVLRQRLPQRKNRFRLSTG